MTTNLVNQEYWDGTLRETGFTPLAPDDFMRLWIGGFVPRGTGDCLEIGCFPGRVLAAFGDLGYRLHGIDLAPRTDTDVPVWLAERGYQVGSFARADFMTHDFGRRFDVVTSLGFIEHFTNWHQVLGRHADLVAPGGYLVLQTPNMSGLTQRVLRSLFDPADFARHHPPAMHVDGWSALMRRLGFEILYADPLTGYAFWRGAPLQGTRADLAILADTVGNVLGRRRETINMSSGGYLGLIARRTAEGPLSTSAEVAADFDKIADAVLAYDRQIEVDAKEIVAAVEAWCAARDRERKPTF